jgi:hypothetical protein
MISSIGQGVQDVWLNLWGSLFEDEIRCVCYDQVVAAQGNRFLVIYVSVVSKIRIIPRENIEDLRNCGFGILFGIWKNSIWDYLEKKKDAYVDCRSQYI